MLTLRTKTPYAHVFSNDPVEGLTADVEIKLIDSKEFLPTYATPGSAGLDVRARIAGPITLYPGETRLVPLGFALNIKTPAIVAKLYPRSGLGVKKGLVLANLTGVIDSDYQNEVMAPLWNRTENLTGQPIEIYPGDRIAQLVFEPVVRAEFAVVEEFAAATERGLNGFGSTGVK